MVCVQCACVVCVQCACVRWDYGSSFVFTGGRLEKQRFGDTDIKAREQCLKLVR